MEHTNPAFYPSGPLASQNPAAPARGRPRPGSRWEPHPVPASPAVLTPSCGSGGLGETKGPDPLARHTHGGGKRGPGPLAPGAEGPGVQPRAPRARAPLAHPLPEPVAAAASPRSAYPGAVVAHHHLPALAVHSAPVREPEPPPPNNLQPPPSVDSSSSSSVFPAPPAAQLFSPTRK